MQPEHDVPSLVKPLHARARKQPTRHEALLGPDDIDEALVRGERARDARHFFVVQEDVVVSRR